MAAATSRSVVVERLLKSSTTAKRSGSAPNMSEAMNIPNAGGMRFNQDPVVVVIFSVGKFTKDLLSAEKLEPELT